jgi:hypothetical protein
MWLAGYDNSRRGWLSAVVGNWPQLEAGAFLPDTNWADISVSHLIMAGVQTDGSLWISQVQVRDKWFTTFPPMTRFGTDTHWKQAGIANTDITLLKTDGTLWGLGTNAFSRGRWKQDVLKLTPHRLGADSDWAEIFATPSWATYRKTDGSIWDRSRVDYAHIPSVAWKTDKAISIGDEAKPLYRNPALEGVKLGSTTWCSGGGAGGAQLGVCEDGTLRVICNWQPSTNKPHRFEQVKQRLQIGTDSNWVTLAAIPGGFVTLKSDGTLWRWDGGEWRRPVNLQTLTPTRLDTHTDWIGICHMNYGIAALAADGSLWQWQFNSDENRGEPSTLLGASRKPRQLGNIFASAAK